MTGHKPPDRSQMPLDYTDRRQLAQAYEMMTANEIAEACGVSRGTIIRWLHRHKIRHRRRRPLRAIIDYTNKRAMERAYAQMSIENVAAHCGLSPTATRKWLHRHGIQRRKRGQPVPRAAVRADDAKTLAHLYQDKRKTIAEIAEICAVKPNTIKRYLAQYRIHKPPKARKVSRRRLVRDYRTHSVRDLALKYGVQECTVRRWLDDYSIPRRNSTEALRLRARLRQQSFMRRVWDAILSLPQRIAGWAGQRFVLRPSVEQAEPGGFDGEAEPEAPSVPVAETPAQPEPEPSPPVEPEPAPVPEVAPVEPEVALQADSEVAADVEEVMELIHVAAESPPDHVATEPPDLGAWLDHEKEREIKDAMVPLIERMYQGETVELMREMCRSLGHKYSRNQIDYTVTNMDLSWVSLDKLSRGPI